MKRYVVSLGDGDYLKEGNPYVVQGEFYAPIGDFGEARVFTSRKRAERACLNRGVLRARYVRVREIDENGNLIPEFGVSDLIGCKKKGSEN